MPTPKQHKSGNIKPVIPMIFVGLVSLVFFPLNAIAASDTTSAPHVMAKAFADHCFSPFLTAQKAEDVLTVTGARVDFYDLDPFSDVAPSSVALRPVTKGTNRRCEVAFDGDHTETAVAQVLAGLKREGITTLAEVPPQYEPTKGTALLAARLLNPRRLAVVHVGRRMGPAGIETFMLVERLPNDAEIKN